MSGESRTGWESVRAGGFRECESEGFEGSGTMCGFLPYVNLKENGTNEPIYKSEIVSQM